MLAGAGPPASVIQRRASGTERLKDLMPPAEPLRPGNKLYGGRQNLSDAKNLKRELDTRFRAPLMRFFYRRVGERTEAEDLTQEVFVRLIGALSFEGAENANAFVFKVAANLLRDRLRRAGRWRARERILHDPALFDELAQELVEDRGPDRVLVGKETLAAVMASLKELGDRTCNMFILFRLENMKLRDIAALYGISQSTVEKHIMRAVMHLTLRHGPGTEHCDRNADSNDER